MVGDNYIIGTGGSISVENRLVIVFVTFLTLWQCAIVTMSMQFCEYNIYVPFISDPGRGLT